MLLDGLYGYMMELEKQAGTPSRDDDDIGPDYLLYPAKLSWARTIDLKFLRVVKFFYENSQRDSLHLYHRPGSILFEKCCVEVRKALVERHKVSLNCSW